MLLVMNPAPPLPNNISLIVAIAPNRVIGDSQSNDIPWRVPGEQKRFKDLTTGHTIIMGRKTYLSIGRPLPNRQTIVVTSDPNFQPAGTQTASSLEEAIRLAGDQKEVFVVGGASIYGQALPLASKVYLTVIHFKVPPKGDVFFPDIPQNFACTHEQHVPGDPSFTYSTWTKLSLILLAWPFAAQAYFDPGQGSFLIQAIISFLLALPFFRRKKKGKREP